MIGSKQFTIGPEEIVRGAASSNYVNDGGFSNLSTFGMNLTAHPGVLFGSATMVDTTHPSTGLPIASCGDSINGFYRVVLSDNGKIFTADSAGVLTERSDSTGTYVQGTSDIVQYRDATYATSQTNVCKISGATFGTLDEVWWSATIAANGVLLTGNRHPLLVFEDNLWIGDKNMLHRYDGTTSSKGFLTLPAGQNIVGLSIDPNSGKMLISITEGDNINGTLSVLAKVGLYDGFSSKLIRVVIVDEMVTAMYPLAGVVYMTYGKNFGYWNGSGINWIRKLKNVTLTQNSLIYKHKITNVDKTLYLVDGAELLAYGEVLPGKSKVFYGGGGNPQGAVMSMVCPIGSGKLCLASGSTASPYWWSFDVTSVATTSGINFYSKKYRFKQKVQLRSIAFQYFNSVAASTNAATVVSLDATGSHAMSALTNTQSDAVYELETTPAQTIPPSKYIQFQYQGTTVNYGIEQITISYDEIE